ncbi:hypothetical protein J6590_090465 [Homalodisca vitripennis]|nr:hypothetical protein J6590_090465 [Homalodisca vitripennis]
MAGSPAEPVGSLRDRVGFTPKKVTPGATRPRRSPLCYATAKTPSVFIKVHSAKLKLIAKN